MKTIERKITEMQIVENQEPIKIGNTPFATIKTDEGYAVVVWNMMVKNGFETREEAEKYPYLMDPIEREVYIAQTVYQANKYQEENPISEEEE